MFSNPALFASIFRSVRAEYVSSIWVIWAISSAPLHASDLPIKLTVVKMTHMTHLALSSIPFSSYSQDEATFEELYTKKFEGYIYDPTY